jgi:hypothetical protein
LNTRLSSALAVVLLASLACSTATDPDAEVTETFSGTVQLRSSIWHDFTVAQQGTVRVTLTSLTSSAPSVGLAIGAQDNGCDRQTSNDEAQAGAALSLEATAGEYCVMLYDNSNLSEAAGYTVTVTHP